VEVAQRIESLEQFLADFLDLSLQGSVRTVQLLFEESLRVNTEQLISHVLRIQVTKALLRLREVHLSLIRVEALATVLTQQDGIVEKLVKDALLYQLLNLDRHFFCDSWRKLSRSVEVQVHVEETVDRTIFACGLANQLPRLWVHHFILNLLDLLD